MIQRLQACVLTVFGRSLLLIFIEVTANALCWAIAARSHAILGLALLSWTIGLRHALDADHISAIDNATRTLLNHGRLATTCGLFFSLGHSTIVIVVNVAIVVSANIYNKLGGVGSVGSIIGTAISGSFLFIVGLANSVILCRILGQRRMAKYQREHGETSPELVQNQNMLMMRLLGPLINFVDRPWKMYPVGVLFGLGFDTASSIALLAISALAKDIGNGRRMSPSEIIVLPLLFTTGMTLVDSLDSILVLYSYTGFVDHSWRIFELGSSNDARSAEIHDLEASSIRERVVTVNEVDNVSPDVARSDETAHNVRREHDGQKRLVKQSTMSELCIVLTAMSILLAFSISLIEILGLIGANCNRCESAASAPDGGGLAGAWWRFWAKANEYYGYIGAGVVGMFVVVVGGWYVVGWVRACI